MERILLFLEDRAAARKMKGWLLDGYQVTASSKVADLAKSWDLAIVDPAGLRLRRAALATRKPAAQNGVFPVLLVAPAAELEKFSQETGVDEVIRSEGGRGELLLRVRNLLELRGLRRGAPAGAEAQVLGADLQAANQELRVQPEASVIQNEELLVQKEALENLAAAKAAEEAVRRAGDEWERTFDAIPDLIAILDREHRVVRGNRAMAAALGLKPAELVGRPCYEAVHGLGAPPDFCPHSRLVRNGQEHSAEVHEFGRDFLVTVSPLTDGQGNTLGSVHVARDITVVKAAEKEIRRLASFPLLNPNPVLEVDQQGQIIFANPAARQVAERSGLPEGVGAFLPPDLQERLAAVRQGGVRQYSFDLALGDAFFVVYVSFPHDLPTVRLYAMDFTARQRAEEERRESREDLNRAQAVAHTGSWRLEVRRNELTWSDENHRIFGIPQGTPMTYETFLSSVHPEDREYVDTEWTAALSGEPYDIEHRIVVDGRVKWVRERAELEFDPQGQLLGGFGTTQDITERKQAEEAIRRQAELLDLAHDAIFVRDLQDRIVFWNRGAAATYGWSREEALGENHRLLLKTEFPRPPEEIEQELLKSGHWEGELTHFTRDGRRVTAASSWVLHREVGKPARILQICTDITARKQAEEELKRTHGELERRVRARTADLKATVEQLQREVEERRQAEEALRESEEEMRFLAAQIMKVQERERARLSRELHDGLGQALLVFKLTLRSIQKQLPARDKELRQDTNFALQYIDEIIEDVRRMSHNLSPTVLEDIGLFSAIRNLCDEFRRLNDLEVALVLDEVEELLSKEAQINIYRIFQEALTNISKYADAGRISLAIKKQGDKIAFAIEDDGAGFDVAEVLTRAAARKGLGLAAMTERVRILGGELEIASQAGRGTRIAFQIPVRRD